MKGKQHNSAADARECCKNTFLERIGRDAYCAKGVLLENKTHETTTHDNHVYPHFDHARNGHSLFPVFRYQLPVYFMESVCREWCFGSVAAIGNILSRAVDFAK